ncbi:hypothetical protein QC762_0073350 [Podospora pseudocomata]|uniref:Uncharacterized protein n=1 Tax=Podospora pseudocomata TaxID=2093779 RepID=A0ABR0G9N6_9PEZI|nr:hypothetical protein QC762_0073350 [Podospora pseudocomata]
MVVHHAVCPTNLDRAVITRLSEMAAGPLGRIGVHLSAPTNGDDGIPAEARLQTNMAMKKDISLSWPCGCDLAAIGGLAVAGAYTRLPELLESKSAWSPICDNIQGHHEADTSSLNTQQRDENTS